MDSIYQKLIIAERKIRPEVTDIIIGSSGAVLKAEEVAKETLDGIKSGSFSISFNLEGHLLAITTAGASPQRSFLMAFLEVVLTGISQLVALFFYGAGIGALKSVMQLRTKVNIYAIHSTNISNMHANGWFAFPSLSRFQ